MRLRVIKKMGGSYFVQLKPSDLEDLRLQEGDTVDIDDLIKENGKKRGKD